MWKRLDFESFQLSPLSNQIPPKMHKHEQKGKWASLPWGRWIHSVFFKYSIPLHRGIKHFKIVYYHFKFRTRKKNVFGVGLSTTYKNQRSWLPPILSQPFSYVYSINRDKTLPLYYLAICCK